MRMLFIYELLFGFLLVDIEYHDSPKGNINHYEIENAGIGKEGYYLVRVWSYVKDPAKVTSQLVKRNAIHGVIFRGFSGQRGFVSQCPMVKSLAIIKEKAEFFSRFLGSDGDYIHYADLVGVPEVVKMGKEYKIGYVVEVAKDRLRKVLEEAGVINKLTSAF